MVLRPIAKPGIERSQVIANPVRAVNPPVFRFAPSPNGELHLGHALSAILNHDYARAAGGRFLLRIEDIDIQRCRPEFEAAMLDDLAWLGLRWETPVRRQSEHFADYESALGQLADMGLVYPSFASRKDIAAEARRFEEARGEPWPRDPDGAPLYPFARDRAPPQDADARLAAGEPHALRLDMKAALRRVGKELSWTEAGEGPGGECGTAAAVPEAWGDVLIARKDVPASYHVCVVVDDALQGVTHVVRGRDLFWSTSVHRLLQELLGLPVPVYEHHRLILDENGAKLSKSARDTSLRDLRAHGATPADIRRRLCLPPE